MQIPAGFNRQGSAGKMTNGGLLHPVAHQGPAKQLKSCTKFLASLFYKQRLFYKQGNILPSGVEGYPKLMRLDRGCADSSLQRLRNFGNPGFFLRQRFQFAHIGWGPRAPDGLFLFGHNGSSFQEARFYHTQKN
jgi:hypothetical protein